MKSKSQMLVWNSCARVTNLKYEIEISDDVISFMMSETAENWFGGVYLICMYHLAPDWLRERRHDQSQPEIPRRTEPRLAVRELYLNFLFQSLNS